MPRTNTHSVTDDAPVELHADVLVIGGGPAGTWAAVAAAQQGARVILVDKGYCGTSGATAPSGTGVWYVPPHPEERRAAMGSRYALGGFLAERVWMERVLEQTYANVNTIADWGYPFPTDDDGRPFRRSLRGPEYMRLMRRKVLQSGVKILDHSPALSLLVDEHGVGGATGIRTQTDQAWTVIAGAVVIATGGCAFLSKALGCNVLTGDGLLMSAEAGAELSGMEFSNAYAICPKFSSVTKTLFYNWATFYYESGEVIEGAGSQRGRSVIARTLLSQPVYARIDKASEEMQTWMRQAQPNFFVPFDRAGINPFQDRFEVTLRLEGTVRGTGGIRLVDETCATGVPGLYAAGDAATRELICGGFTGGGSHNAAWAMSSGYWAGQSAARYAHRLGDKHHLRRPAPLWDAGAGPRQAASESAGSTGEVISAVQQEVMPCDRNLFRCERNLNDSLRRLDAVWHTIRYERAPTGSLQKRREAEAMTATARWMYTAALERTETRGMHKRTDFQTADEEQQHRLVVSGLDEIHIHTEPVQHPLEVVPS
ncbi:FAD-dependent oxidoreductase [Alicyclobacillus kakegawensis]|uniref:FAD-dependent oxidoreductase n=1 Tax=Alicyclobacillus kakegawensis TaxID=392012 RepID=UPI00082AB29A|nr:FAD-binding protein [Alicyclobacillus kakegawensis]